MTRAEHVQAALDWAEGRRSYTNMARGFEEQGIVAIMDAMEVVKHVFASFVAAEASTAERIKG